MTTQDKPVETSLADVGACNGTWTLPRITSLPTEDCIRDNLKEHKQSLIESLNPSRLVQLLEDLELDDVFLEIRMTRKQEAERLLTKVIEKSAYSALLRSLEEDTEHMGHRYIASLLRGEQFETQEEITSESTVLMKRISEDMVMFTQGLNVDSLEPYLVSSGLLTTEEQSLLDSEVSALKKSKMLLHWLKTKGPTAHYIFVHKCLINEKDHCSHSELYSQLTNLTEGTKRKSDDDTKTAQPTKVTKCYPPYLEPPQGITTTSYFQEMWAIRQFYQSGRKYWGKAEDVYREVMISTESPLEMKIAFLLESTYSFILDKQSTEVFARVDKAREMCNELYRYSRNAQAMEGRCEWILAKHYRYTGEHDKALSHLKEAFFLIGNYEPGEEKALANYCHGCTLVDMGTKTPKEKATAINALTTAVGCADQAERGVKIECILKHGKIRLAQAYLGSSPKRPVGNNEEVPGDCVEDAKRILGDIHEQELDSHPRTKCMFLYTWSDVYKACGQFDEAGRSAELALDIAEKCSLKDEQRSVEVRQQLLRTQQIDKQ